MLLSRSGEFDRHAERVFRRNDDIAFCRAIRSAAVPELALDHIEIGSFQPIGRDARLSEVVVTQQNDAIA